MQLTTNGLSPSSNRQLSSGKMSQESCHRQITPSDVSLPDWLEKMRHLNQVIDLNQEKVTRSGGGMAKPVAMLQSGRSVVVFMDRSERWPGESLMPNTSEWHNDADACLLSQVLEQTSIPQRYFLSSKACAGILRRAEKKKEIASAIIANGAAISGESLNPCLHADIPPGMKSTKAVNAFRMAAFGEYIDDETASTVKARDFKDATDLAVFSSTGAGFWSEGHGTLRAREQESHEHLVTLAFPERMSGTQHAATKNTSPSLMAKNPTAVCYEVRNAEVAVRRLTPVECERLQGFPDGHTLIPTEKRKKVNSDELAYLRNHYPDLSEEEAAMLAADGPRYKAIGNSMAIPVMRWIGDRITKAVCRQKEGSETKERKVKPAAEFERSIFKWAGGKFGVLEQIFRYLPEGKRLIEPFVGGGAVFMNAGYQENLLNDVNADLINFYKTLQREAHSLITLAHRFFQDYNTQEGYLAVRNAFNKQVYDDLHRAAAFLFLNRHCFNGLTRYNQAGEFNVGYGKYKTPYFPLQEMEAFLGAEGRSEFVCGDFAAVIEAAGEGDVIFCDPPYEPLPNTEGFTNYSGHDFKFEEQKRLVSLLTDAHRRGAKVLITNSGAPNIRELYHDSGFRVEPLFARRSVSCKGDTRGVAHDVLGILL